MIVFNYRKIKRRLHMKTIEKTIRDLRKRYKLTNDDITVYINMSINFKIDGISFHHIDIDNNIFKNKNKNKIKDLEDNDIFYFSESDTYNDINLSFFSKNI
jgi:hypothetical protein